MSAMTYEYIVTQAGDMVDDIAYQRFGSSAGYTEQILDANPGLAALGPKLPAGLTIAIPIAPQTQAPSAATNLWS